MTHLLPSINPSKHTLVGVAILLLALPIVLSGCPTSTIMMPGHVDPQSLKASSIIEA